MSEESSKSECELTKSTFLFVIILLPNWMMVLLVWSIYFSPTATFVQSAIGTRIRRWT